MRPTSWSAYNAKAKRASEIKHPKLNVFATRYSLARGLPSVQFSGFAEDTSDGYSAALRLAFAYTALESALGEKERTAVVAAALVAEFRDPKQAKFLQALIEHQSVRDGLRSHLLAFADGGDDNLRWIAYAIRNLMFHGSLTAAALQLNASKRRRNLLNDLAVAVLDAADEHFTRYVKLIH